MHVVFQQQDVHTLSKSFELDESLKQDVVEIKDDYAVGPIVDIFTPEGRETRKNWWRQVLSGSDLEASVDSGRVNDEEVVTALKQKLDEDESEQVWIWVASNKHDVSGYYWLVSQLQKYAGRVYVLHLNNLPFINEKGNIFYPENLFEILPKEFIKAKKLARPITASEFELDPDEWTRLCNENKMVRILEGAKKLSQHNEDYFDKSILSFAGSEWQKASRVIYHFLSKAKQTTGDAYILWRIKEMISAGILQAKGELKNSKDFEVKPAGMDEE